MNIVLEPPGREDMRAGARKRLEARRDLASHLAAFVIVNASLVGIWVMAGGYFWPAWVIGLWCAGLLLHAWGVLWRRPITASDIDDELERHRRP